MPKINFLFFPGTAKHGFTRRRQEMMEELNRDINEQDDNPEMDNHDTEMIEHKVVNKDNTDDK